MALRDPVAVYNAANNLEAHFIRNALLSSGIDAFVTEDVSQVGTWVFGLIPEIHKPQVWVERTDIERAKPILEDYERRCAQRRNADTDAATEEGSPIEVACEACGRHTTFSASQRGSVQQCPNCGAYVDVGEDELPEGWSGSDWTQAEEEP
jgi:hypothetical protein